MKYKTIYADPPWPEYGAGKYKRGAQEHYKLMSIEEIKELPVEKMAADDSHLYLWVTNQFLPDGIEVLKAWGFEYKANLVWIKDKFGLGYFFRGQHELLLFGVRGKLRPLHKDFNKKEGFGAPEKKNAHPTITTVINAKRTKHSRKPKKVREMIELISPRPYIELFSRDNIEGWDHYGNEVPQSEQKRLATTESKGNYGEEK